MSDATATRIIANLTDDDFPGKVTKESWKSGKTDYFPVKADLTGSDQILTDGHRWLIKQYDYLDDENKNELVAVAMELVSKQLRKEAEFVRRKRSAEHELMQEVAESQADYETQKKTKPLRYNVNKKVGQREKPATLPGKLFNNRRKPMTETEKVASIRAAEKKSHVLDSRTPPDGFLSDV